nr:PEP-utilizing enzyme [Halegenticoccus tardaugens]
MIASKSPATHCLGFREGTSKIRVVPSTGPGWAPLFLNAAGLVSEVGGAVSHGALVAREYGLPAVVSVPDASKQIRTRQHIRLDGTHGTVELLVGQPATKTRNTSSTLKRIHAASSRLRTPIFLILQ